MLFTVKVQIQLGAHLDPIIIQKSKPTCECESDAGNQIMRLR